MSVQHIYLDTLATAADQSSLCLIGPLLAATVLCQRQLSIRTSRSTPSKAARARCGDARGNRAYNSKVGVVIRAFGSPTATRKLPPQRHAEQHHRASLSRSSSSPNSGSSSSSSAWSGTGWSGCKSFANDSGRRFGSSASPPHVSPILTSDTT